MAERLVVTCRRPGALGSASSARAARLRQALIKQAAIRGGAVCAWSADVVAMSFDAGDRQAAVKLAAEAASGQFGHARAARRRKAFAVGLAAGELIPQEVAGLGALGFGPVLARSEALARLARAGEVLIDPLWDPVTQGTLLTRRARWTKHGPSRLRGLLLELETPWRPQPRRLRGLVVDPGLLASTELPPDGEPHACSVLRADPGRGGTRLLDEWLARQPGAKMFVAPGVKREPLGALRAAVRSHLGERADESFEAYRTDIDALLSGQGLRLEVTTHLLGQLLCQSAAGQLAVASIALDDGDLVDRHSLLVLRAVVEMYPVQLLVRLRKSEDLPAPLLGLPLSSRMELPALSEVDAVALVQRAFGADIEPKAARRLARRGRGNPGAVLEATLAAVSSGDLVRRTTSSEDARWEARTRASLRGPPVAVGRSAIARLAHLDALQREVVAALALSDGPLAPVALRAKLASWGRDNDDLDGAIDALTELRWVARDAAGQLRLRSRTVADVLLRALSGKERSRRLRAAGPDLADAEGPMRAYALTLELGADEVCLSWADNVAARLAELGWPDCLHKLASLYEADHPDVADRIRQLPLGALDALEQGAITTRETNPPPSISPSMSPPSLPPLGGRSTQAVDAHVAGLRHTDKSALDRLRQSMGDAPPSSRRVDEPVKAAGPPPLPPRRSRANGHIGTEPSHRRRGLEALRSGRPDDALRELSKAVVEEPGAPSALAYGVALAQAGRPQDALLYGLRALALARRQQHARGEQACRAFLRVLAERVGDERAAAAWGS